MRSIKRIPLGMILSSISPVFMAASCPPQPSMIAVKPLCVVEAEVGDHNFVTYNGQVFVAQRDNPLPQGNFSGFRSIGGPVDSINILATNLPNVFAFSEATLVSQGAFEVHRAELLPLTINDPGADGLAPVGVHWIVRAEDRKGVWNNVDSQKTFSFQASNQPWSGPTADSIRGTARLMPSVGDTDPHLFACAGSLTENGGSSTTDLFELRSLALGATVLGVQDLFNGDEYFVPNRPLGVVPLPTHEVFGPAGPFQPTVSGPHSPPGNVPIDCAITQIGDDVTTRTLHMVALSGNQILHAVASNFGPVTQLQPDGTTLTAVRFRTISSSWEDVLAAQSVKFGNIMSVAIVGQSNALSIFFVENDSSGRYRIWHTVRFANGTWRPAVDIFADNGISSNGLPWALQVSAGTCPSFGAVANSAFDAEIVLAIVGLNSPIGVSTITVLHQPQQWAAGLKPSSYSPFAPIAQGALNSSVESFYLRGVHVFSRAFSDLATLPP